MSFCNPQIEGKPRSAISIELFDVVAHFSSRIQGSVVSFRYQLDSFFCRKIFFEKRFYVLRHIRHILKFLKNGSNIDISRCSNWVFSATTGLRSLFKILLESFTPVAEDSLEKQLNIILASKFWWSKISRKLLLKMISVDYPNGVSS